MRRTIFSFFTKAILFSTALLLQQASIAQKAFKDPYDPKVYIVEDGMGHQVKTSKFSYIGNFSRSLAVAKEGFRYGYINGDGQVRIGIRYEDVRDFGSFFESDRPYATVKQDNKWGLITWLGKPVIWPTYANPLEYSTKEGVVNQFILFYIKEGGKKLYGLIDETFKERIQPEYDEIKSDRYDNIMLIKKGAKYKVTVLDKNYETIIDDQYDSYYQLTRNLIYKVKDDKYTLVDGKGKVLSTTTYDEVYDLGDSLVKVTRNGKHGYIDLEGKEVVPCIYEEAQFFEKGQALVKLKGTEFYIDKKGNKIGGNSMNEVKNALVGKWQATRFVMGKYYDYNFTTQKINSTTFSPKELEEINESIRKTPVPQFTLNDDGTYMLKNDNGGEKGKWTLERSNKKAADANALVFAFTLVDFSESTYVIYNNDKSLAYLDINEKPVGKAMVVRSFLSENGDVCTITFERKEN